MLELECNNIFSGKEVKRLQLIKDELMTLWDVIRSMKFPTDLIDIVLVAVVLYYCMRIIFDARAGQLLKGIVLVFVIMQVANMLNLSALGYIINNLLQYGFLAIIVVFQPELRTVLEKMGRTNLRKISIFNMHHDEASNKKVQLIDSVVECCKELSSRKIGGLMVLEKTTKLGDIIDTGITVDSEVSTQMLGTIFFPNTPLHDGAVVIRDTRIAAAGCLLPLTQRMELSSSLGTRHRAAVGISEVSDALTVVISEETGRISVTKNGEITIGVTLEQLKETLKNELVDQPVGSHGKGNKDA